MSEIIEVKVSQLQGRALDYAAARADGLEVDVEHGRVWLWPAYEGMPFEPTGDWEQVGRLLHEHGVSLRCIAPANAWEAECWDDSVIPSRLCVHEAETPHAAICMAIADAKLGPVVSVPKELV
jgi:hypothetical protein